MSEPVQPAGPHRPNNWTPIRDPGASLYESSTAVVVAGVVLMLFGLMVTFGAAVALLGTNLLASFVPPGQEHDLLRNVMTVSAVAFLTAGVLQILAAIGIIRHRVWGRLLGTLLAALWIAVGAITLFGSFAARETIPFTDLANDPSSGIATGSGVIVIYGFVLLALLLGGRHFAHRGVTGG